MKGISLFLVFALEYVLLKASSGTLSSCIGKGKLYREANVTSALGRFWPRSSYETGKINSDNPMVKSIQDVIPSFGNIDTCRSEIYLLRSSTEFDVIVHEVQMKATVYRNPLGFFFTFGAKLAN